MNGDIKNSSVGNGNGNGVKSLVLTIATSIGIFSALVGGVMFLVRGETQIYAQRIFSLESKDINIRNTISTIEAQKRLDSIMFSALQQKVEANSDFTSRFYNEFGILEKGAIRDVRIKNVENRLVNLENIINQKRCENGLK